MGNEIKLRITSIAASEVGQLISNVTTVLEDRLRPHIEAQDYGADIEQFAVFFVSVDSDALENERYCVVNNRSSRYKHLLTGKMVKFVGIAVPVDPALVLQTSPEALHKILQDLLLEEMATPAYALPQKFDRQRLEADFRTALTQGRQQS